MALALKSIYMRSPAATTACSSQQLSRRQHVVLPPRPYSLQACLPGLDRPKNLSIARTFADLKKQGKVAFIPYITAGDPDLSTTAEALRVLDACGSKIMELGIPSPNPLADGPVIQASVARALVKGTSFDEVISMLKEVVPYISSPISLFSYYNTILNYGVSKFLLAMNSIGICGLIIPDLPFEVFKSLSKEAKRNKIELVLITNPTAKIEQMKIIAEASEGFLYLASHSGATGARSSIDPEIELVLKKIKKLTDRPICVGFGISKPEHVRQLSTWGADGVIVGSAIVKLLGEAKSPKQGLRVMEAYARSLTSVLN